jgi:hypothetical protein
LIAVDLGPRHEAVAHFACDAFFGGRQKFVAGDDHHAVVGDYLTVAVANGAVDEAVGGAVFEAGVLGLVRWAALLPECLRAADFSSSRRRILASSWSVWAIGPSSCTKSMTNLANLL